MPETPSPADDLIVGGEEIAVFVYGNSGPIAMSNIYRNVLGLPTFHHGQQLAAFKSALWRRLAEIEAAARKAREPA